MPVCKLMPGELPYLIRRIIDKHYDNLKRPKPLDVTEEIFSAIFPHLAPEVQKLQLPTFGRKWSGLEPQKPIEPARPIPQFKSEKFARAMARRLHVLEDKRFGSGVTFWGDLTPDCQEQTVEIAKELLAWIERNIYREQK